MGVSRRERRAAARAGLRRDNDPASVHVHVRELVLRGVDVRSRYAIAEAATQQIATLMTAHPPTVDHSSTVDDVVRTRIETAQPSTLGFHVGAALHNVITGVVKL